MLLSDFLGFFDFDFEKDDNGFHLIDIQGANLGGIESETFDSVWDIVDRLDIYYNDYIWAFVDEPGIISNNLDDLYNGDYTYEDLLKWMSEPNRKDICSWHIPIVECIINPSLINVG